MQTVMLKTAASLNSAPTAKNSWTAANLLLGTELLSIYKEQIYIDRKIIYQLAYCTEQSRIDAAIRAASLFRVEVLLGDSQAFSKARRPGTQVGQSSFA
jgi:hypothetical protein